jgi:hypothetical protein
MLKSSGPRLGGERDLKMLYCLAQGDDGLRRGARAHETNSQVAVASRQLVVVVGHVRVVCYELLKRIDCITILKQRILMPAEDQEEAPEIGLTLREQEAGPVIGRRSGLDLAREVLVKVDWLREQFRPLGQELFLTQENFFTDT